MELVFPQTDGRLPDSVETAEREIPNLFNGVNQTSVIPELPDRSLKVGKFIHTAMERIYFLQITA